MKGTKPLLFILLSCLLGSGICGASKANASVPPNCANTHADFMITPLSGSAIPTQLFPGQTNVPAVYTVTNCTNTARNHYLAVGLASTVTQVAVDPNFPNLCPAPPATINLAAFASCTLEFNITGIVNQSFAICNGMDCTAPNPPLHIANGTHFNRVTGGSATTAILYASNDSKNWTPSNPLPAAVNELTSQINSVASNSSLFVAVGFYLDDTNIISFLALILTSTDGINWVLGTLPTSPVNLPADLTSALNTVTWSGSEWMAVGGYNNFNAGLILTSPDAVTWTEQFITGFSAPPLPAVDLATTSLSLSGVAWNGQQWVAVGQYNNPSATTLGGRIALIVTSPDGVNWTAQTTPSTPIDLNNTTSQLVSVTWNGQQWIAVGSLSNSFTRLRAIIVTSPDGVNWTEQTIPANLDPADLTFFSPLLSVTSTDKLIVAVGFYSNPASEAIPNALILTSTDGVQWTQRFPSSPSILDGAESELQGVSWNGSQLLAVGEFFNNPTTNGLILNSTDGITWTQEFLPFSPTTLLVNHALIGVS